MDVPGQLLNLSTQLLLVDLDGFFRLGSGFDRNIIALAVQKFVKQIVLNLLVFDNPLGQRCLDFCLVAHGDEAIPHDLKRSGHRLGGRSQKLADY